MFLAHLNSAQNVLESKLALRLAQTFAGPARFRQVSRKTMLLTLGFGLAEVAPAALRMGTRPEMSTAVYGLQQSDVNTWSID